MMDSHQLARNRKSLHVVLNQITCRTLVIGIDSDILFPVTEQQFLAEHIPNAEFKMITSHYGHDGFLVEYDQLKNIIKHFFHEVLTRT
jgi:homoserine O-acetyltransferase